MRLVLLVKTRGMNASNDQVADKDWQQLTARLANTL
jgi:hypothetical protein